MAGGIRNLCIDNAENTEAMCSLGAINIIFRRLNVLLDELSKDGYSSSASPSSVDASNSPVISSSSTSSISATEDTISSIKLLSILLDALLVLSYDSEKISVEISDTGGLECLCRIFAQNTTNPSTEIRLYDKSKAAFVLRNVLLYNKFSIYSSLWY